MVGHVRTSAATSGWQRAADNHHRCGHRPRSSAAAPSREPSSPTVPSSDAPFSFPSSPDHVEARAPHRPPATVESASDSSTFPQPGVTPGPAALPDAPTTPSPPAEMPPVMLGNMVSDQSALAPANTPGLSVPPPDAPGPESVDLAAPHGIEATEAASRLEPTDDTPLSEHPSAPFNLDDGVVTGTRWRLLSRQPDVLPGPAGTSSSRTGSSRVLSVRGVSWNCLGEGWSARSTVTSDTQVRSAYADDPLWPLLAHLAGRDVGTLPGADHPGAATVHLPATWLRPGDPGLPAVLSDAPVDPLVSPLVSGLE